MSFTCPSAHPVGEIVMYGGAAAPNGFLLCDGTAVSRTTYSALFTAISTAFGSGDGSTTFNVPDLRGRFALGKTAAGTGSTLGGIGGHINHTHAVPGHNHSVSAAGADIYIGASGAHTHTVNGQYAGSGAMALLKDAGADTAGNNFTSSSDTHQHDITDFGGRIGLVTDGSSGDAEFDTGTGNPPFQAVNFIIRY